MIKEPWGPGTPWKNKSQFMTYLRGCLRKAWVRNPVKLNLIKKKRIQIKNPNPRGNKPTVWGFTCEICDKDKVIKEGQVDHIISAGRLNEISDVQGFVERLLCVSEEDLRLICTECHKTHTYAEKMGISYEEAALEKQVIAFKKLKAEEQLRELRELGIRPAPTSAKRVEQYRKYVNA